MRRTTEHVGRNALQRQTKTKQLIADACMTFQGTQGARRAQPLQKHHFVANEFMRKTNKKGIYSSIHDRFQNDKVFHASQLQHNCTQEWCEYFDYIRTIDMSNKELSRTIGTMR